jgi:hypothetical protein
MTIGKGYQRETKMSELLPHEWVPESTYKLDKLCVVINGCIYPIQYVFVQNKRIPLEDITAPSKAFTNWWSAYAYCLRQFGGVRQATLDLHGSWQYETIVARKSA